MDLKEFVSQALQEIVGGVREANGACGGGTFSLIPGADRKDGRGVHFDVAVTSREEKRAGGGVSARIAVVKAALGREKSGTTEQVSRIVFSVDVGTRIS